MMFGLYVFAMISFVLAAAMPMRTPVKVRAK